MTEVPEKSADLEASDTLAIAERLLAKGPVNPQTGREYKWTLEARVAHAIRMAKVANRPELILLRSLKMKALWQDDTYRNKVIAAAREANADPLTAVRRRTATEEALCWLRENPHRRQREDGTGRKFLFGGIAPRLDDRGGYVYIAYEESKPEGPYKIGSSFGWQGRKEEIQTEGYHGFFKPGCKLAMIPFWVDWFRRTEIRAHEMLGMDWEYKYGDSNNKRYEMCWLSLPVIISAIYKAIESVRKDMEEKEAARKKHGARKISVCGHEDLDSYVDADVVANNPTSLLESLIYRNIALLLAKASTESFKNLARRELTEKQELNVRTKFFLAIVPLVEGRKELVLPIKGYLSKGVLRKCYRSQNRIQTKVLKRFLGKDVRAFSSRRIEEAVEAEYHKRIAEVKHVH